jgi:hypothetical protein
VKGLYQSLQGRQEDQGKVDFRNREWNLVKQIGLGEFVCQIRPCRSNRIFLPDLLSLCGTISCRDIAKVQTPSAFAQIPG